ncbi:hypothetical protein [Halobacillus seohaensis]|uniref:ABC transporter permease n=1 Tax=Halobacillus seohaensis TaxID=447421 RepID=A0ABW2EFA0_9BACI
MNFSTWEVYRWVRQQRFRKKLDLYKQAFQLAFDVTLMVYCMIFGIAFLFMVADWLNQYLPLVERWQINLEEWVWILPSVVLLRACAQSFFYSGIAFTTSELKLSMLPHTRLQLLWHMAIERGFWHMFGTFLLALILGMVTPFSYSLLLYFTLSYSLFFTLSMFLHWKLYSLRRWLKLIVIVSIFFIVGAFRWVTIFLEWNESLIGLFLGLGLLGINIYLMPRLLRHVDWGRVVEMNDARVWNIQLISHMTKVPIKPPKRYGILQTFLRNRRAKHRFTNIYQLYHRLWRSHLHQQFGFVWKTVGIGIIIIGILPFQADWVIYISVPIAFFVYIEMAASLFADQFRGQPILSVLPIEEKGWRHTYAWWAMVGMTLLFIAFFLIGWTIVGLNISLCIQFLALVVWSKLDLDQRLKERMNALQRKSIKDQEGGRVLGYLFLGFGMYFPPAVVGVFLPYLLARYIK